ncbi:GtrA family protein [Pseudomonas umsongensis]|jgi:putative flippase GtrA|uniref:Bactoprenol-linked glucose translocase n=1 Tax=Pseudomonas umsongensis TaxID=198618 RepID=A0AAE7A0M1_9PSED|nr:MULTISPECIES: GtrA family protein [Pseudomonas]KEX90204.1 sugar translocase [Pseudomonas putida]MDP9686535.1 putative flippase GtrA [Pseudomonas mohnii]EPA92774.1 putative membrane protein [Pseudomonas sp. G5(2012)]MBD0678983.1 GtrA family protein [Pseudomonas sp. PSB11]MBT9570369.1 GtrA family protein [Pseudomonas umsongensis]
MRLSCKGLSSYTVIGVANTLIHWQIFFLLSVAAGFTQAASNLAAFCVAASFSFYMNALYTFDAKASVGGYLSFMLAMGALSFGVGHAGDVWRLHGLLTVALFSGLSLVLGFLFSKYVVFRERDS